MKSISILGVFVADLCFIGDRIPSKGQTILGKKHVLGPGGKGSNQAIAAARLNGEVSFITKVGKDSHSEMAFNLYKEAGVKTHSIIQDEKLFTGVAGIMIDKDGNNAINVVAGAAEHLVAEDIDNKVETIKNSEIFLTQMETPDEITIYALKKAKEHQCITILNPAPARKIDEDNFCIKDLEYFKDNLIKSGICRVNYLEILKESDLSELTSIPSKSRIFISCNIKGVNVIDNLGLKKNYLKECGRLKFSS